MSILTEIFTHKRQEVATARSAVPLAEIQVAAAQAAPALDFSAALHAARQQNGSPALIAEVKAASPSRGTLVADFDPLHLAKVYAANGAAAISVLTDERYFRGHLDHLRQVRRQHSDMPLLRKDFICDPYQVYEGRATGADAILLIVAGLEVGQLGELQGLAHSLGMAALVEVHTAAELETALACQARLIGINNRNLHTFQVSLETSLHLRQLIPNGITVVAESGIRQAADARRLGQAGIDAFLVGEALVTAPDIAAQVRALSTGQAGSPLHKTQVQVKICGIRSLADAQAAVEAGADLLGFNFYPPSPRSLEPDACREIVAALRARQASATLVGVFVNAPAGQILETLDYCGLDLAQLSGDEPGETLRALGERAFKALRLAPGNSLDELLARCPPRSSAPAWLIDAHRPGEYGGTGNVADWSLAAGLARQAPLLLAGGLTAQNVAAAIAQVQPWGVDVASGVESAPGVKDYDKMRLFIQQANQ